MRLFSDGPLEGSTEVVWASATLASEDLGDVEVVREAELDSLVESVDPGVTDDPLSAETDLGLNCGIGGKLVLTSPVENGGLSTKSLKLSIDVIDKLVSVQSIVSVSVMATNGHLLLEDISNSEVVRSAVIVESKSLDGLESLLHDVVIKLDSEVVVILVNVEGSLKSLVGVLVVPGKI